ncbi:MAG: cytochrome c-type biosis protein CcmE [Sphingomonadales bacterium]|nr:cytochrome c-type biosis protein CcmE [Sphingomonadales bacterium]
MKRKNQRLVLLLVAAAAMLGAVLLAMSALKDQASYFYAPADVRAKGLPLDRSVRVGGMVKGGSIRRQPDGVTIRFLIGDDSDALVPVEYRGITPELFRENAGVIAEGRFRPDGSFAATEILARHDENYMPPELAERNGRPAHKTDSAR